MLRPDWPYMGPIHHIKLSARRQLKFPPVTYFFISSSSPQILFLPLQECKHDEHIISLVANGPMLNSGADTFICSFSIHSIQACCPFCEGLFPGLLVTHIGRGLRAFHGLLKHFHSAAWVLTNSRIQCKSNAF